MKLSKIYKFFIVFPPHEYISSVLYKFVFNLPILISLIIVSIYYIVPFENFSKEIESLGINKITTIDYLNLQSLGIKDYQKILAEKDVSLSHCDSEQISHLMDRFNHYFEEPEGREI